VIITHRTKLFVFDENLPDEVRGRRCSTLRRIILVFAVALIMVAMLAASALPAMAANGPPCDKAIGLAKAHRHVPEGNPALGENPAHEHIPCDPDD